MVDVVSDMLTRIRNGQHRRLMSVDVPHSNFREQILKVMQSEGYIKSYTKKDLGNNASLLSVDLKYLHDGTPIIQELKGVSKPGRRVYTSIELLTDHYNSFGVAILSTSKGVMSDVQARQQKVGGEIICRIF